MCQDREYFDFHQAGVLQERLNRDTGMLAEHLIQQPRSLVVACFKVFFRVIYMYRCKALALASDQLRNDHQPPNFATTRIDILTD